MHLDRAVKSEIKNCLQPLMRLTDELERLIERERKHEALQLIREQIRPKLQRAADTLDAADSSGTLPGVTDKSA
jgi:hypothetical protein